MKRKLLAATDCIVEEVQPRSARLWKMDDHFGVVLRPTKLVSKDRDEIGVVCEDAAKKYDGDFSVSELWQKVEDAKFLIKNIIKIPDKAPELLSFIEKDSPTFVLC